MTKAQKRKFVMSAISKWADRMNIRHYRINVMFMHDRHPEDTNDRATSADIHVLHEYTKATIRIWDGLWELDPAEREASLVHELAHIILEPLDAAFSAAKDGQTVPNFVFSERIETATEHFARLLVEAYS